MADDPNDDSVFMDDEPFVIHNFYDGSNSDEHYENELERALEMNYKMIIIEPSKLGEETARWIYIGNHLERSAILSGLGSLLAAMNWPDRAYTYCPMAAFSIICTGLYSISWSSDPCSTYMVQSDASVMDQLRSQQVISPLKQAPIILVKTGNYRRHRIIFHRAISLIAFTFSSWKLYTLIKLTNA